MRSIWGLLVLLVIVVLSGCTTTGTARVFHEMNPDADNARFVDGQVVYTSVLPSSAVEMRLRDNQNTGFIIDLYVENLSDEEYNFGPADVRFVRIVASQGKFDTWAGAGTRYRRHVSVYWSSEPDAYSEAYADAAAESVQGTTGGVATYLYGGTIGEAIIASNQVSAEVQRKRAERQATAEQTRQSFVGLTTLRPGESVAGGFGMVHRRSFRYLWADIVRGNRWGDEVWYELSPERPVIYTGYSTANMYVPGEAGYPRISRQIPSVDELNSIPENPEIAFQIEEAMDSELLNLSFNDAAVIGWYRGMPSQDVQYNADEFFINSDESAAFIIVRAGPDYHVFQLEEVVFED